MTSYIYQYHGAKKNTIRQLTTMLVTSKNVLFPGHNHLLTNDADGPHTLMIARATVRVITKVSGHQHRWLAGGYDLEIGHFFKGDKHGGYLVDSGFVCIVYHMVFVK